MGRVLLWPVILTTTALGVVLASSWAGSCGEPRPGGPGLKARDDDVGDIGSGAASGDLYGLGVRVGFYVQGLGMLLNLVRNLEDSGAGLKLACGGISLSILISWIILASQANISPPEAFLVLSLVNCVISPAKATLRNPDLLVGEGIGLILLFATDFLGHASSIWFFATLCTSLPTLGTQNTVFFFREVSVVGWFRILALLWASVMAISIVADVYGITTQLGFLPFKAWSEGHDTITDEDREKADLGQTASDIVDKLVFSKITSPESLNALNKDWGEGEWGSTITTFQRIFIYAFNIATVEKTIQYNGLAPVTDLKAPGQLIPFVVGITVLIDGVSTFFRIGRGRRSNKEEPGSGPNFSPIYFLLNKTSPLDLIIASVLLFVVTITSPITPVAMFQAWLPNTTDSSSAWLSFGTFGYCLSETFMNGSTGHFCSGQHLGYNPVRVMGTLGNVTFDDATLSSTDNLSQAMVLHPISFCLSILSMYFIMTQAGSKIFACFLSWLSVVGAVSVDYLLFVKLQALGNSDGLGASVSYNTGLGCVVAALVLLTVGYGMLYLEHAFGEPELYGLTDPSELEAGTRKSIEERPSGKNKQLGEEQSKTEAGPQQDERAATPTGEGKAADLSIQPVPPSRASA